MQILGLSPKSPDSETRLSGQVSRVVFLILFTPWESWTLATERPGRDPEAPAPWLRRSEGPSQKVMPRCPLALWLASCPPGLVRKSRGDSDEPAAAHRGERGGRFLRAS